MSTMLPTVRGKSWVFQVTLLCIVLGALLGFSLRTQRELAQDKIPSRISALRVAWAAAHQENKELRDELAKKKKEVDTLSEDHAQNSHATRSLVKSRDEARLLAGMLAVRGPGVVVTLVDSPKLNSSETNTEVIEQFMVHEQDIRAVVDELCAAGAEAISINEQRRIATSSIRCVGPVVLVNTIKLTSPYVIKAVGNANDLEKVLLLQGGPAADLIMLEMITVKKESVIDVPAYTGSTTPYFAKPVAQ